MYQLIWWTMMGWLVLIWFAVVAALIGLVTWMSKDIRHIIKTKRPNREWPHEILK